jgi:hypothetical protein
LFYNLSGSVIMRFCSRQSRNRACVFSFGIEASELVRAFCGAELLFDEGVWCLELSLSAVAAGPSGC